MSRMRRVIDFFVDSPTYGRDRATLLTGFTVGTAGLLLNGAVLLLVLPLMVDPDDPDWRPLTQNLEFGQLLALILLGGATIFATLLVPLRLVTVFWGPRIGRYFDQVVLSGISPLRFVIGKATAQNLYVGLILFLLLPYLVLSLTLGGMDFGFFLAGGLLVWLYCIALALVTLWASLYLNELLAAVFVVSAALTFAIVGCIPMPVQPFVITPFPALLHPVYSSIPGLVGQIPEEFLPVFMGTVACLVGVIGMSLFAIHLGPLYGIVRENSTFGEVVREGDRKRNRWFRLRQHIQRPSEIAFFYENRSAAMHRNEGLVRWGVGLGVLLLVAAAAYLGIAYLVASSVARWGAGRNWWIYEFHASYLTIHGFVLAFGVYLFSHPKNTTYLRIPFTRGWTAEVSRLDTVCFLLLAAGSTAAAIGTPYLFEQWWAGPHGTSVFPDAMSVGRGRLMDFVRIAVEGSIVLSVAGLVVYAFQRMGCLLTWVKSGTLVGMGALYFVVVCVLPLFFAVLFLEIPELRDAQPFAAWAPLAAMMSPFTVMMCLFNEMHLRFPQGVPTTPFYAAHGALLVLTLFEIRRRGRKLRALYLAGPNGGTES